jgi:hypothetical protein
MPTHTRRTSSERTDGTGGAGFFISVTNVVESMISICRDHAGNVKRWRDAQMGTALVHRRHD